MYVEMIIFFQIVLLIYHVSTWYYFLRLKIMTYGLIVAFIPTFLLEARKHGFPLVDIGIFSAFAIFI